MPTLDFKGKQFVYSHHLSVPFRELKVDAQKSLPLKGKKPSLDDNLIIHGDNLEALKALLPTHAGKVDCIFIDPPYNTGNEGWCYNDNVRSPLMQEWLKKSANPVDKDDLERHDKWLCMMWPRINLLKDLLNEKGSIWVTLDENEFYRARAIFDEVFGESNYISTLIWQKKYAPSSDAKYFSENHDFIMCYAKNKIDNLRTNGWVRNLLERTEKQNGKYKYDSKDGKYLWRPDNLSVKTYSAGYDYPITNPNTGVTYNPPQGRCWATNIIEMEKWIEEKRVFFGKREDGAPQLKRYLNEVQDGVVPLTIWLHDEVGHTDAARKRLKEIFEDKKLPFDNPKPTQLIEKILKIATRKDSLILDSFAGSGTTAHSVVLANKKDNGNRKFILVECEDYADRLTAERIRRVINGYSFSGVQKEQLLSEKITWSVFNKKHRQLMEKVEAIEAKYADDFDKIKKEIKDGVLTVTGEQKIKDKALGIGGSFAYCTLGEPIQIESLLVGKGMPSFDALARYVFYTATGQSLDTVAKTSADGFIGETDLFRIHLFYQPDSEWLRSNGAALNNDRVKIITENNKAQKRTIVFAVAKFISQKELTTQRIEFCQLPYSIHRLMGS